MDYVGLSILVLLLALFILLFMRARRIRNPLAKGAGMIAAGMIALVLAIALGFGLLGFYRVFAAHNNPKVQIQAARTPEQIARGERLAHLCVECHSSSGDLPLDGGKDNLAALAPFPVGTIIGPNLTPGTHMDKMSDGELVRAIREGVDEDERPLLAMPTGGFRNLSDVDVQAIVAYLRSQPKVDHDTPDTMLNVVGAILQGIGLIPSSIQSPVVEPIYVPHPGTVDYGKYLVAVAGCRDCHGQDLAGGKIEGVGPEATNLTTHLKEEDEEDFAKTIRAGRDHEGNPIDPKIMPWKDYSGAFDDTDLKAMFAYLQSLPVVNRPTQ